MIDTEHGTEGILVWASPAGTIRAPFVAGLDGGVQIGVTSLESIPGCLWHPGCGLDTIGYVSGEFLVRHLGFKAWLKPNNPDCVVDGAASLADSTPGRGTPA